MKNSSIIYTVGGVAIAYLVYRAYFAKRDNAQTIAAHDAASNTDFLRYAATHPTAVQSATTTTSLLRMAALEEAYKKSQPPAPQATTYVPPPGQNVNENTPRPNSRPPFFFGV